MFKRILFLAAFMGPTQPIIGKVWAELAGPFTGGQVITLPLYDDGQHGDAQLNDEIYANMYTSCGSPSTLLDPVCSFSPPPPLPDGPISPPTPNPLDAGCPLVNSGDDWTLTLNFDGSAYPPNPVHLTDRPVLRGKVTIEHNASDQGRVNIPVVAHLGCGLADVNCDGRVDIRDILGLASRLGTNPGAPEYYYDPNQDGVTDLADLQLGAGLWRAVYRP
jgi:hypothetical protein